MAIWTKDPDEEADFSIDWSDELGVDTILDSDWPDPPTGIDIGTGLKAPSNTATTTTIWLSGGAAGEQYTLTNRITTLGGRTFDQEVSIRIDSDPALLPDFAGCDWPLDPACLTGVWDTYSDAVRERATHLASATLYRLTGYRVGGCPLTVRPSAQGRCEGLPVDSVYFDQFSPLNWNGQWTNVGRVTDTRLVELPGPIGEIIEVKVDGVVIDENDYRIIDNRYLGWVGAGESPWPLEQDWVLPDTEVGTFSVTYLNAYPVDSMGAYAAGLLAMEFASACASGGKKCKLPSNIVSIVRQGVSYELSAGAFPDGKTSIREVDAFIEQWNPKGRKNAGMVFNPGRPKVHTQR